MSGTPIFPRRDQDFLTWILAFAATCATDGFAYGMTAAQLTAIQAVSLAFQNLMSAMAAAEAAFHLGVTQKDNGRDAAEEVVREMKRTFEASPNWNDVAREKFGFPPLGQAAGAPAPDLKPDAIITLLPLMHVIEFYPKGSKKGSAMPDRVQWVEVHRKIVGPGEAVPTEPDDSFTFAGVAKRSPFKSKFTGGNVGKTAYYFLRYVTDDGEELIWSELFTATITGAQS